MFQDFFTDGAEIYRQSAKRIAAAIDITKWPVPLERLVVERVVHAVADPTIADLLFFKKNAAATIATALEKNATILCDSQMTSHGLITGLINCRNEKISLVDDPRVKKIADKKKITRSHAQIFLWHELLRDQFTTAVVVIGNAPTCLYGLLQGWHDGTLPQPAGLIAMPVGFVGAAEAKQALKNTGDTPPFITILGPRGGSAVAAAATNALLSQRSIGEV
ncbi:MAG: precorrin-8X methylmutase [Hydrotalea sp.]|nr:precorrin-8X methylmutase [Hydrotalea sp.]